MLRTTRTYNTLTAAPTRGPLPPMVGVIIPIARTNIVTNPSIELATTGYTAVGGSIARSATQQYHGTYSLAVTPGAGTTDGAYYTTALTTGLIYAFSCKFKGIAGVPYKISLASTAPADLSVVSFVATGRWQWVYGYYLETSTATRRFYFTKNGSTNTGIFYVDGVQIEVINAGETVSTYIDGDQLGLLVGQQPPAYLWTGTPHASTSTRSALTRAGGYVVNLSLYNFILVSLIGLGMAVPNNVSIPYTVLDGARYQRTTKPPRTFTLTGRWQSDDPTAQYAAASEMRQTFDRDLVPLQQPMVLTVEPQDNCGQAIGDFAQIPCIYAGGLEGNDGNVPVEDVAPTFTMYVPYLSGGDAGASLGVQQTVTNANAIAMRSPTGVWSALSTGMSGGAASVYAIARGLDGTIYAGGDFTDAGGSGADYIARWTGSAWATLQSATSINGPVFALAVGPDGRLYVGGNFTNAGGVGAADYIAVYDPAANTYAALSTGLDAACNALAFAPNGTLYLTGSFTTAGGGAARRIASWNGSAFAALGTGLDPAGAGVGLALATSPNNQVYVGGGFTNAGGTVVNYIARWTGSAFVAMAGGMNNSVRSIALGPNGLVYAAGDFTTAGGISASYIARWNGTGWAPLGTGLSPIGGSKLAILPDGRVLVGGSFTSAGGITLPDSFAVWNGSAWTYADVDLPGSPNVFGLLVAPDGTAYAGFTTTGSATSAVTTTVTNDAPGYVYPRLVINGPSSGTSRIYQIVNYTTGFGVWLNLTLNVGEVATLDFNPQAPNFTTTFQGDVTSKILPGSQPALMYLAPGNNVISFFAANSTVVATLSWQRRYNGIADLVN